MSTLLCVGDLGLDLTITASHAVALGSDTSGTIQMHGGGSAANVAAWAARAGLASRFIGAVGDDPTADFLVDELLTHGVDVRPIRRAKSRSRAIAVLVGEDGNRSLISDQDTTVTPGLDDYDPGWFEGIDWLHLTGYTYIAFHSRALFGHLTREATARSIPYSIDPSAAQLLRTNCHRSDVLDAFRGARILFPSHDEAEYLTGTSDPAEAAEQLLELAHCVAVTCGPDGVHIARRGYATIHVEAQRTTVVNTLGCGDAFVAGFLAAQLAGHDFDAIARLAVERATVATHLPSAR